MAVALAAAGITAFIPYLYGRLVDMAISPLYSAKTIGGVILLWLFLSFLSDVLNLWSNRQAYEIATDVTNYLLVDIFHHLINLPLKFHKERKMGKVMRRIERGDRQSFNFIE